MPALDVPSYRHFKPRNLAVVTLNGRDHYLGKYDSPESRAEYDRLIGEWLANGRTLPTVDERERVTVNEVMLAYVLHAEREYRNPDGTPKREVENVKHALRLLKRLYGHTRAMDFGPRSLHALRQAMIKADLCRNVVNKRVGHVKRMFRWASEHEVLPPEFFHRLTCVSGLRYGKGGARETEPVTPVPEAHVDAIVPYLPPTLQDMLALHRLTGMRSGELVQLRAVDIDMTGDVWLFRPVQHKTRHQGHERVVRFGPKCKPIIEKYLAPDPSIPLFSPRRAMEERWAIRRACRKTRVQPSQACRRKARPKAAPGDAFTTKSYYLALRHAMRAAEKAGKLAEPEFWHPHQLRHNAALRIQREESLEAARAFLGHAKVSMTAHYAGLDEAVASRVAARMA